jgi:transposase
VSERETWFVGIDWGVAEHQVCVVDGTGAVRGERTVAHRAGEVHAAVDWLLGLTGVPACEIAVAIERPHGIMVDTLLERGFVVWALNPKQLDRFRDRFTPSGAKDDTRDAHVLADALRTDRRAFRPVRPDAPEIIHLRELCRLVDELQVEEGRLANRLREQLYRVDAPWLTLCPAADEPWLWTLLATSPHADAWPRLTRRHVTPALRAHRIRRFTVEAVLAVVRTPRLTAAPGVADAVATRITSLVPQLLLIRRQRVTAEHEMDGMLETLAADGESSGEAGEHRDAAILLSLPGVGRMVSATMLTEASGLLAARDYATLRLYSGVAPVTKRSGKRLRTTHMRYACNLRLRQALYHWGRTSIQHDPRARTYYQSLRARGHQHGRALRSVADRWLRILMAMLKTRTLYHPHPRAEMAV